MKQKILQDKKLKKNEIFQIYFDFITLPNIKEIC